MTAGSVGRLPRRCPACRGSPGDGARSGTGPFRASISAAGKFMAMTSAPDGGGDVAQWAVGESAGYRAVRRGRPVQVLVRDLDMFRSSAGLATHRRLIVDGRRLGSHPARRRPRWQRLRGDAGHSAHPPRRIEYREVVPHQERTRRNDLLFEPDPTTSGSGGAATAPGRRAAMGTTIGSRRSGNRVAIVAPRRHRRVMRQESGRPVAVVDGRGSSSLRSAAGDVGIPSTGNSRSPGDLDFRKRQLSSLRTGMVAS
jgi:hypothetical protein